MARTGLGQFIGFAQESTVGTRVAPTRFLPIVQGGLKEEIEPIRSAGIVPGNLYLTAQESDALDGRPSGAVSMECVGM